MVPISPRNGLHPITHFIYTIIGVNRDDGFTILDKRGKSRLKCSAGRAYSGAHAYVLMRWILSTFVSTYNILHNRHHHANEIWSLLGSSLFSLSWIMHYRVIWYHVITEFCIPGTRIGFLGLGLQIFSAFDLLIGDVCMTMDSKFQRRIVEWICPEPVQADLWNIRFNEYCCMLQ